MANGTIAFDTLQTSGQITGTAKSVNTDYVVNGSAKSWIHFTMASTFVNRNSFNVASLTDNGAGDGTATVTNNMSDEYSLHLAYSNQMNVSQGSVSSSAYQTGTYNTSNAATDASMASASLSGDLA